VTDVTKALKQHAHSLGADLAGVADLAMLEGVETTPPDLLQPFIRAVSLAVKLPTAVFEPLVDRPTPLYAQIYLNANLLLDQIALRLCGWLERHGTSAFPIPASQVLDMEDFTAHLSAKAVANAASCCSGALPRRCRDDGRMSPWSPSSEFTKRGRGCSREQNRPCHRR